MQPKLSLLDAQLIERIIEEAYQLMIKPGIKVQNPEARQLLADAGAQVDEETMIVKIPEQIVRKALETVPHQFLLYDYDGNPKVQYGGDAVQFDPGSSGISILIPETLEHKTAETADLIRIIKIAESLPQYDAQSTAIVCHDVPKDIPDLYRLYLVMLYSKKPIVTGAFTNKTVHQMIEMLAIFADTDEDSAPAATATPATRQPWPADLPEQMRAVADTLATSAQPLDLDALATRFTGRGPWKKRLPQILETLAVLGRASRDGAGAWRGDT